MKSIILALAISAAAVAAYMIHLPSHRERFHAKDITGVPWGKGFELNDTAGGRRTLADFRGKVVLLSFGYTSCPDICPTTLALIGEATKKLGPDARRI
jgi:protein SCO1/2